MKSRCLLALALAGACGIAQPGQAAEPLRLEDAIARAVAANPALAAESAQLDAARARAQHDALPTPYIVGGDLENVAGSGALSGVRSAETTLRVGRTIELGGKRSARISLGDAEIARQQHTANTARLEIESRTRTRYIEVQADQARLQAAREQVALAERTRREVAGWVAAARNPESDLRAAEIAVAEAELAREHAEHELASARLTLAASWGAFSPDFDQVDGDLTPLPPVEPFEALAGRLPESPAQRAARLDADRIAARRRLAEASAKPDLQVSLGVRRLEALDDQGLVMSVSVPLGTRQRAAFSVAEADAELAALDARREADRIERYQALFETYQELLHARTEYESLRTKMLPKAEQALAFTRRGFEAGRFSFVSVAQAQKTLFDLRKRSVDAAARYHTLLIEVQRLAAVAPETAP
ncbi:TolC family protein [Lysobacter hankyongensis]|uniref:TolC family protein n=1 Tax=Lysobacter hankyongensis TaxID=1176535 RepID=A0ABP9BN19_9GAMM